MATKRWLGSAQSVRNVWTLSLSGTVTSQNYTITINGKTLTYAAGGSDTATTIFDNFRTQWASTSSPVPPEFAELSTSGTTTLILTGKVSGRPHTVAFATDGGATATATETTAASGPNFFNVGANWSGGVAPANSDVLVFDSGNVACKYGLSTSLTGVTVQLQPGYSGQLGLPDRNTDGLAYYEYRTQSLVLDGGTLVVDAPDVDLCRVGFGSTLAVVRVLNSGNGRDSAPAVMITGGAASSTADISRGYVGFAFYATETANFPTVRIGYVSQQSSDARVVLGVGCTVTTITKSGGVLDLYHNATTLTQDPEGGTTTLYDAVAISTVNVNGGTVNINTTGTLATINIRNDGVLNANADSRAKTVTNAINMFGPDAEIFDDSKTINSGVLSLVTVGVPMGNIHHGVSNTISVT